MPLILETPRSTEVPDIRLILSQVVDSLRISDPNQLARSVDVVVNITIESMGRNYPEQEIKDMKDFVRARFMNRELARDGHFETAEQEPQPEQAKRQLSPDEDNPEGPSQKRLHM